jgi:TPR repeat protein
MDSLFLQKIMQYLKLILLLLTTVCFPAYSDFKQADAFTKSKDYTAVYSSCIDDAQKGEKNCQSHIGNLYRFGLEVTQDFVIAAEWFKKAADQNQISAQEALGVMYRNGQGVDKNNTESYRLIKLSADQGYIPAINNLGNSFRLGVGVPQSYIEAFKYYKLAAEKGNAYGQANLSNAYRLGQGVDRNLDLAFEWALKSSKQNNPSGHNLMGLLFRDGTGVKQDTQQAISFFKLAIESKQEPVACANLAFIYYRGIGLPIDYDESAKWLKIGIEQNNANSFELMAWIFVYGSKSISKNPTLASQYFERAISLGNIPALNGLGYLYREGLGVTRNFTKSKELFEKAIKANNADALVNLAVIYVDGLGENKNLEKAEQLILAALKKETLGTGTRKYAENFMNSKSQKNGLVQAINTQEQVTTAAVSQTKPIGNDDSRKFLDEVLKSTQLEREQSEKERKLLTQTLEKMQKQLESLQASANTASIKTEITDKKIVFANRKALVVGNDDYTYVNKLNNAVEDANGIAKTLESVGYKVFLHKNLNEKMFKQALRDFRLQLQGGDEVLVFFAGHGVQLGSANYLLPIDLKGDNEEQVKDEAIQLQRILDDLDEKKVKFALAIIDACRDNPFKSSGRALGGRGLAPTTAATGQMVMFSAGAGQQALDKLGANDKEKNGLFTRLFIKEMVKPGIPVDKVLRNVRNEVVRLAKTVGHEQTPALYDQAIGDFYFLQ